MVVLVPDYGQKVESLPKQFIPIFDGKSLFDLTIERILDLQLENNTIFVCSEKHRFFVRKSIEKYNINSELLLEQFLKILVQQFIYLQK